MAKPPERSGFDSVFIADFAGINEDETPDRLAQNELVRGFNVARFGSAFGTRPGCGRELAATGNYSAALPGAVSVQGLVEYSRPFAASVRMAGTQLASSLIAISNGKVYSDSATEITKDAAVQISTPGAGINAWTFAQHKNVLYMAGGQDTDTINRWTGAGVVERVTFRNGSGTDIDAKYIFQKWNYGFLGGMNGATADDNPMVVRYSALGDMTSWPAGNTVGGSSSIGGFDAFGDNWVTGFGEFTDNDGDWLLCLTRRQIYGILRNDNPYAPFRVNSAGFVGSAGCVSQRAFVSLGVDYGDAIYLSDRGIHSLRQSQQFGGREDKFLSWKIRKTFEDTTKLSLQNACGGYWPNEGIVLFAIPYLGGTTNSLILCLDLRGTSELNSDTARWYTWRLSGQTIASMTLARDTSGNERIYFGTNDGSVARFSRASYSDLGAAYGVRFTTKDDDFGKTDVVKGFGDIYTAMRPGGQYKPQMTLYYDRGSRRSEPYDIEMPISVSAWNSAVWGSGVWSEANQIITDKHYGDGLGYTLSLDFQHSGLNEPFFVTKLSYQVSLEGESEVDV